jgi:hypothetical protein
MNCEKLQYEKDVVMNYFLIQNIVSKQMWEIILP